MNKKAKNQWINDKIQFVIEFGSYIDFGIIKEDFRDIFGGSSMQLPVPEDAPAEIPRLILKSQDGNKQGVFSKKRFEFTIVGVEDDIANNFYNDIFRKIELIKLQKIFWVGFVFGKIKENKSPNDLVFALLSSEIKETIFNPEADDSDLTIRYHRVDNSGIKKNVNIEITSAIRKEGKRIGNLLIVDVNTKPEREGDIEYNMDIFQDIFLFLKNEMENTIANLKKYE